MSDNPIHYANRYELGDLEDDDLVTKYLLENNISPVVGQITTEITAGVTTNPITVAHTGMVNPTLIFRNADGSNYGGAVNNVDDGTSIELTGDGDGSGKFADSFTWIMKQ